MTDCAASRQKLSVKPLPWIFALRETEQPAAALAAQWLFPEAGRRLAARA
jgi:hypothetical protein